MMSLRNLAISRIEKLALVPFNGPVTPQDPPLGTPEALGIAGGLALVILGVVIKEGVVIGVGSSLTAAGLFSAVVRKTRRS
jgi:hypothetical protein